MQTSAAHSEAPQVQPTLGGADRDDIVMLRGVTWADYQRLLEIRGERAVPRFTYLEGTLELMSPSRSHEYIKSVIGCLVEAWCLENEVDFSSYGSWTLERKDAERGLEPDECYIVGLDAEAEEATDRPHLAIEVIWTSGSINKLEVYRKLRVGEIWIWRKGKLRVFALRGDQYEERRGSEVLAGIDLDKLLEFVDIKPQSQAIRRYRAALRR